MIRTIVSGGCRFSPTILSAKPYESVSIGWQRERPFEWAYPQHPSSNTLEVIALLTRSLFRHAWTGIEPLPRLSQPIDLPLSHFGLGPLFPHLPISSSLCEIEYSNGKRQCPDRAGTCNLWICSRPLYHYSNPPDSDEGWISIDYYLSIVSSLLGTSHTLFKASRLP